MKVALVFISSLFFLACGGSSGDSSAQQACGVDTFCSDSQYCRFRDGSCGSDGVCVTLPEGCLQVLEEVCGCDGQNYSNSCFAAAEGVSIEFLSSCDSACL